MLDVEPIKRGDFLWTCPAGSTWQLFRHIEEPDRVPRVPCFGLTALDQLGRGVLPDRFEHPVPESRIVLFRHNEGAIDESRENIDDVRRLDAIASAYTLDGCERTSTDKGCQAPQQTALRIREKVIAPLDRCSKRLMPRLPSAPAREQVQVSFQSRCKILY